MRGFLLAAANLCGILLIVVGVFIFANNLTRRSFVVGNFKLPGDAETGFFLIILGMILFGAAVTGSKLFKK